MQTANDLYQLRTQRLSTRAFIVIFIFSSCILFFYTVQQTSVYTFTITAPTLQPYKQLHQQYSQTLTCRCSQISNKYGTFIAIEYSQHPICSSIYISDQWIADIAYHPGTFWSSDFRLVGRHMFQALRLLCQLTQESIHTALEQFYSNNHVTDLAIHEELLQYQADTRIQEFIDSATNNFRFSLRMIRDTSQTNSLASVMSTNSYFMFNNRSDLLDNALMSYSGTCGCDASSTCVSNAPIFVGNTLSSAWFVPGFYIGCFFVEALRQSDLHCFYNQSCIDDLIIHLNMAQSTLYTSMNESSLIHSKTDTQIGTIIDALMVDQWKWNINHTNYFDQCRPKECTYTIVARNSWINIVTTTFGLIGGLVTVLKIIIPRLVQLVRWLCNKRITAARRGRIY